jgi:DNA-binding LytR/AlgR family response regulator
MKITLVHVDDLNEMEITIRHNNPSEAARIKRLLEASQFKLEVKDSSAIDTTEVLMIDPHQIYYFESVDDKVFCYLANETYETNYKLYELEEILSQLPFLRVSKGVIVNISMIKSFRSALSGRLICTLNNDEQIVISRMYVKLLKEKLGVNRRSNNESN